MRPVNGYLPVRTPPIYKVVVRIAEEQVPALAVPYRTLRELKPGGKPLNPGPWGQDQVESRVLPQDLSRYGNTSSGSGFIEIDNSGLYPYEIVGTRGNRTVDSKHCQLNFLPGNGIPRDDQPIRRIEPLDNGSATLAVYGRQRTVYPNFSIVVDYNLESDGGSGGLELAYLLRNRYIDAIPIETDFAGGPPCLESSRVDSFPLGVVEVGDARVGRVVVSFNRLPRWLQVRARRSEVTLDDSYVTVPPLPLDEFDAHPGSKIDDRVWSPIWGLLRGPSLPPGRSMPQKYKCTPYHYYYYVFHFNSCPI